MQAMTLIEVPKNLSAPGFCCGSCCCVIDETDPRPEIPRGVHRPVPLPPIDRPLLHPPGEPLIPHWSSWCNKPDTNCYPTRIVQPTSLGEIQDAVRAARADGLKVRCAGQGHSSSSLVATDGVLIVLDKLREYSIDSSAKTITVTGGVNVYEVDQLLEAKKLCLPSNAALNSVFIAGLVAAGCHGSGRTQRTICELVVSMDIVDSDGAVRTFSARAHDAANPDAFQAAVLSLGTFGVIYSITLQAVDMYWTKAEDRVVDKSKLTDGDWMKELVTKNDVVDLFWWPYTDRVWARVVNPKPPGIRTAIERVCRFLNPLRVIARRLEDATEIIAGKTLFEAVVTNPAATPKVLSTISGFIRAKTEIVTARESVHYQNFIPAMGCEFLEVAFLADDNFANVTRACQIVFDTVDEFQACGRYPFNLTMQLRFVGTSPALLSPAYVDGLKDGGGLVCFIEVLSFKDTPDWENFAASVGQQWMALSMARPHWPKRFEHIPGVVDQTREVWRRQGDVLRRFRDARAKAGVDPTNMFCNDFVTRNLFAGEP